MTDNIEVFKQNSIRIKSSFGNIYVDPFEVTREYHDAAFVMITHDHFDHFSPESIKNVACTDTVLVVPDRMKAKAACLTGFVREIETVMPGGAYEIDGFEFDTVPAFNIGKNFHPREACWVGYVLYVEGKSIYIAGDTDATDFARDVYCDIAIVPVGGTYTMNALEAAELVNEMRPRVAIPVHYGSVVGKESDGEEFARYVEPPVKVEIKISFDR